MSSKHVYLAIDLKSFYASVECVARGLDPLTTNLVVADASRTEKTICLAVTPSLKAYGVSGRARLFEVVQRVKEINNARLSKIKLRRFSGKSYDAPALAADANLQLDYIIAPPRMGLYLRKSSEVYKIYLQFFAAEDVHVYSVDEVFIAVEKYLPLYHLNAHDLCRSVIQSILDATGITATGGIGSNMYLAKIAMDIVAKHLPADKDGVRIAELNEHSYRELLWTHRPLTDFWRIGSGYARKLERNGLLTMGDVARCSLGTRHAYYNAELLYKLFGINAELLIDHAWGYEPCTLEEIHSYVPKTTSLSSGQVLPRPYSFTEGALIVQEMTDLLVLDLVAKGLVTDQLVLYIGYDIENVNWHYQGKTVLDHYGRLKPVHAQGTVNLGKYSSSTHLIVPKLQQLYREIVDAKLLVRRINISANHLQYASYLATTVNYEQLDLFADYTRELQQQELEAQLLAKEKRWQRVILYIQNKYGKNAVLKGFNYLEAAKTRERNQQIGGHKA